MSGLLRVSYQATISFQDVKLREWRRNKGVFSNKNMLPPFLKKKYMYGKKSN